jgi:hypothetical protein
MGRVNNTIDKFGRQRVNQGVHILRGLPGVGFKLTPDGTTYDVEGKVLSNVAKPTNGSDAATKEFVLKETQEVRLQISKSLNTVIVPYFQKLLDDLNLKINTKVKDDIDYVRDTMRNVEGIHIDILQGLENRLRKLENN